MADNKNHPLVDLMLARMDSNPEEFDGGIGRWAPAVADIEEYALPEQAALIKAKIAAIRLDAAHHRAMDELLNGEERRRQAALLQGVPSRSIWLSDTDLQPTQIKLGNETLDEGLLKKIKGALKI